MCFSWGPRYDDRDEYPRHRGRFGDSDSSLPPINPISSRSGVSNPQINTMPGHKLNPDWDPRHPYDYPKFVSEPRGYQPVQGMQAQPSSHQAGSRATGRASAGSGIGGGGGIDPWEEWKPIIRGETGIILQGGAGPIIQEQTGLTLLWGPPTTVPADQLRIARFKEVASTMILICAGLRLQPCIADAEACLPSA
ncbi:hypothetical protein MMC29_008325, partial [Sticta canariensis]|nr:hypothetical protein [Sticta canariensis]